MADAETGALRCECLEGFSGERCEDGEGGKVNVGLVVGIVVPAFVVLALLVVLLLALKARKRKQRARKRVLLKGPTGDLRFASVKAPEAAAGGASRRTQKRVRELLAQDAEEGFPTTLALVASTPSTQIENACKALLYAHHRDGHDVALVKALIAAEVAQCSKAAVVFRANEPCGSDSSTTNSLSTVVSKVPLKEISTTKVSKPLPGEVITMPLSTSTVASKSIIALLAASLPAAFWEIPANGNAPSSSPKAALLKLIKFFISAISVLGLFSSISNMPAQPAKSLPYSYLYNGHLDMERTSTDSLEPPRDRAQSCSNPLWQLTKPASIYQPS